MEETKPEKEAAKEYSVSATVNEAEKDAVARQSKELGFPTVSKYVRYMLFGDSTRNNAKKPKPAKFDPSTTENRKTSLAELNTLRGLANNLNQISKNLNFFVSKGMPPNTDLDQDIEKLKTIVTSLLTEFKK